MIVEVFKFAVHFSMTYMLIYFVWISFVISVFFVELGFFMRASI